MKIKMIACAVAAAAVAAPAMADTYDFSNPGDVAGWTVDRYAPAGFASGVSFGGDERLQVTLSAADGPAGRPGAFSSAFYNTQGKSTVLADALVDTLAIDFYLDADYADDNSRGAGLWGVATDGGANIVAYPIVEFTSDLAGGGPRFQGWDAATGWVGLGGPALTFNTWYNFSITLNGSNWDYQVTNLSNVSETWSAQVGSGGAAGIQSTIVQAYNLGVDKTYYFDNLTTGAVPEPTTWALMILGLGSAGAVLRRRRLVVARV